MISPILAVKDVDASLAFYTQKLGFKQDFAMPGPDGINAFAFVSLGKAAIGLSRDKDLTQRGNGVVLMIYLPEDMDLDKHYADVKNKGVAITEELKTEYWGDRLFSVHDIDGYYLSLCKTVQQVPVEDIEAVMRGDKQS